MAHRPQRSLWLLLWILVSALASHLIAESQTIAAAVTATSLSDVNCTEASAGPCASCAQSSRQQSYPAA